MFAECREPLCLFVKVFVTTWGREEFVLSGGSEERRVAVDKQGKRWDGGAMLVWEDPRCHSGAILLE